MMTTETRLTFGCIITATLLAIGFALGAATAMYLWGFR
jgi:hypothetical protein